MGKDSKTDKQIQNDKTERIMNGVAFWTAYYRYNLHRFPEDLLGIKLKIFQKILLWAMNYNTNFYYIASRG